MNAGRERRGVQAIPKTLRRALRGNPGATGRPALAVEEDGLVRALQDDIPRENPFAIR